MSDSPATESPRRPSFTLEDAVELGAERFGLKAEALELPGDRDRNFRLQAERLQTEEGDPGARYLLEVSLDSDLQVLDLENRVLEHLRDRRESAESSSPDDGATRGESRAGLIATPRLIPTQDGEEIAELTDALGRSCQARLMTYLPGRPMARARPHSAELLRHVGAAVGRIDLALMDFEHAAMERDFLWDLARAPEALATRMAGIGDPETRKLVEAVAQDHASSVAPRLGDLRRSMIHGDANDYNLLVASRGPVELVGLIDFGDVIHSHTVNDVAIAGAYAVMGKSDPLRALLHVVRGYHAEMPLEEAELEVLFDLVRSRLAVSLCMAIAQRSEEPDNAYLSVSEAPARQALRLLAQVHPRLAHYSLRSVCGLPASPETPRLRRWLEDHRGKTGEMGKMVNAERSGGQLVKPLVLDLSVSSVELAQMRDLTDPHELDRRVMALLDEHGADVAYGRWDEPRLLYAGGQFEGQPFDPSTATATAVEDATDCAAEPAERRTVHMGIDLFQPAGSPVCAPFAGAIHSLADNDLPFDYGGTLVLEHRVRVDGEELLFYSLFGHLSKESLEGKFEGMIVQQGDELGRMGEVGENGGWAPHLHYQLTVDMLDRYGELPGVVAPSERSLWRDLCPDPNPIVGVPERFFYPPLGPEPEETADEILGRRRRHIGPNLSISYRRPLHMVAGRGQWLYDGEGRAYLDAVNNVPHVGHCHPHVVRAAARQKAVLETNTRYLHGDLVRYAERLVATLPEPLRFVFFCNAGSEANELALRLARTHTGRYDVVTVEGAYHGHSTALVDISPYKHGGPGGAGAPPWVHQVPLPCGYRGRHKSSDPQVGSHYARYVEEACRQASTRSIPSESSNGSAGPEEAGAAAFICESVLGCGGQVVLPPGYLEAAYGHVRRHGGVAIADEVQVGFGRVGSHFWAFETQGVVPDILTVGKPMGNGHPLAAVITRQEIAHSFANGMEYFNTFGGNPVSCRVGMAVLDVIEEEDLQGNAQRVGEHLLAGLHAMAVRQPMIGEVRGLGLFVGVELVRNPNTLEPADTEADYVVNRLRDHGILISTDGPWHNVLKIKPPMVFDRADADRLIHTLDQVLDEDGARSRS